MALSYNRRAQAQRYLQTSEPSRVMRVLVRVFRTWLQGLVAFVVAGGLADWGNLSPGQVLVILGNAAWIALGPAFIALLMNTYEEIQKVDPGTTQRG